MLRQVVTNNVFLGVQYAAGALVPLVLVPHIVRSIGVEQYGSLAVAFAWGSLAAACVLYAFHLTGPQRVAQLAPDETPAGVFFEISTAKLVLLAGALAVLLTATARSRATLSAESVILFGMPVAAALNASWYLQARGKFPLVALTGAVASVAALGIGFTLVSGGDSRSVWGAAWATIASPLLLGAFTFLAVLPALRRTHRRTGKAAPFRALGAGWPLFASQLAATAYGAAGPIVIERIAGLEEAGAYSAVERFVNALVGACLLTHTAAYPRLAAEYARDRVAYRRLLRFVVSFYLGVAACIAAVIWALHDELAAFVFGARAAGREALIAWSLAWLLLGIFGTALTGYLAVSGRAREVTLLTVKVLGLSLVLGVPAAAKFGGAGWMAALVLSQVIVLQAALRGWRQLNAK